MEQHNIDSRFKKGLEDLNRQPSADAWARLQSQMNAPEAAPEPAVGQPEEKEEKRLLLWWHYAAAAVVLLFISVGIIKNGTNFGGKTETQIASQTVTTPATTHKVIEAPAVETQPEIIPEKAVATTVVPPVIEKQETNKETKFTKTTAPAEVPKPMLARHNGNERTEKATRVKATEPVVSDLKPVQPEEKLIAVNTPAPAKKAEPKENKIQGSGLAGMAIEVIVKRDNSSQAVALQAAPEPETENDDSKLKSIFKQARKIKEGEKLDLQALGLNTDSKLAMGTKSLTQKFSKVLDI